MTRKSAALQVAMALAALLGAGAVVWAVQVDVDAPQTNRIDPDTHASLSFRRSAPERGTVAAIARRNVLRLDRSPPAIAYDPLTNATGPNRRRPTVQLVVLGVLLGSPRAAVLGGLPGVTGSRLLEEGETVGDITLLEVLEDTVTVRVGPDTLYLAAQGGVRGS